MKCAVILNPCRVNMNTVNQLCSKLDNLHIDTYFCKNEERCSYKYPKLCYDELLEKCDIINRALQFMNQISNFSDLKGTGTYSACFGHDDLVMAQLQMVFVFENSQYKALSQMFLDSINTIEINNFYNQKFKLIVKIVIIVIVKIWQFRDISSDFLCHRVACKLYFHAREVALFLPFRRKQKCVTTI